MPQKYIHVSNNKQCPDPEYLRLVSAIMDTDCNPCVIF